jgi:acyl-coenzyme A thioesterase 13
MPAFWVKPKVRILLMVLLQYAVSTTGKNQRGILPPACANGDHSGSPGQETNRRGSRFNHAYNSTKMTDSPNPALQMLRSQIGKEFRNSPSPFGRWLKGKLLAAERGALTCEYTVREEMANPAGTLHGGIIAAIMDDLMGATMFSLGETTFKISVNLSVDFFYPARPGEKVIAKTKVAKEGKQLLNVECELYHENGKLMARGTSNLFSSNIAIGPSRASQGGS